MRERSVGYMYILQFVEYAATSYERRIFSSGINFSLYSDLCNLENICTPGEIHRYTCFVGLHIHVFCYNRQSKCDAYRFWRLTKVNWNHYLTKAWGQKFVERSIFLVLLWYYDVGYVFLQRLVDACTYDSVLGNNANLY